MPSLSDLHDRIEKLYLKTGYPIHEGWYEDLVSVLHDMSERGAVDYSGYVHRDLIPDKDLQLKLGKIDKRFLEMHSGYGYFEFDVFVQGKRVIKDEDPIYIADLFTPAREKVTEAVDYSKATSYLKSIDDTVLNLMNMFKPTLLAKAINFVAGDFADVFDTDIVVSRDGRVRFKFTVNYDVYTYVKWIPKDEVEALIAMLNAGVPVPKDTWQELDFTVLEGDKINFRISPSARITIFVYNIPNT